MKNANDIITSAISLILTDDYELRSKFRIVHNDDNVIAFPTTKICTEKNGIVQFTKKEIDKMPQNIKKLIVIQKKHCSIRKHASTKGYEIRFRSNGYSISASGKTVELAKENFINKLRFAKPKNETAIPKTFNAFANFYFENFRKELVGEKTFYNDMHRYKNYILPCFGERALNKITPVECKKLLDEIKNKGKGKTADEIYSLLNVIFKSAINHSIIDKNPLGMILHIKHEKQTGKAFTREEENKLYEILGNSDYPERYRIALAIGLFCGLRPNEYYKVEYKPPFIIAVNSKRKNRKIEYKRIPIINALKPFVKKGIPTIPAEKNLRLFFKKFFPSHTLKDLRKTFNSRCKEFNVSEHARKHFMGHSIGALDSTYTELTDEYLLKEAEKLNAWEFPIRSPFKNEQKKDGG